MRRCVSAIHKALNFCFLGGFFQFCVAALKKALICLHIWVVVLNKAKHNTLTIKRNNLNLEIIPIRAQIKTFIKLKFFTAPWPYQPQFFQAVKVLLA